MRHVRPDPPMVEPVLRPRPRSSDKGGQVFRWLRWTVFWTVLMVLGVVAITQHYESKEAREEARLKAEMVRRGMSAQEIEQVVRAKPSRASRKSWADQEVQQSRLREIEVGLIHELASLNRSAEDIERIHQAFCRHLAQSAPEQAEREAQFVCRLARSGRSAAEIERLIRLRVAAKPPAHTPSPPSDEAQLREALQVILKSGITREELLQLLQPASAP